MTSVFDYVEAAALQQREAIAMLGNGAPYIERSAHEQHRYIDASKHGAVIAAIPGDAELLRSVAAKLVATGRDAVLAAPDDSGTVVLLMRAPGSTLDCGAVWKQLAAKVGGRGGGRPERAEGRVPSRLDDFARIAAELV